MPGVWDAFWLCPHSFGTQNRVISFCYIRKQRGFKPRYVVCQVSIRVCDVNQGKLGEKAIALVLPTLLHKGVGSRAEEVRAIRYEWVRKFSFNHLSSFKSVHPSPYLSLYSRWNNYLFWGTNVVQTHKMHKVIHREKWNGLGKAYLTVLGPEVAPPQTSLAVRSSRIHFSLWGEKWMRDERTLKDVCREARPEKDERY